MRLDEKRRVENSECSSGSMILDILAFQRGKKEEREKEVVRLYESGKANKKHSESLLRKCEWLADEQVHFNKRGGIYDFDGYSVNRGTAELKETIDRIEAIERTLCMKNVSNLDTCEAKVILKRYCLCTFWSLIFCLLYIKITGHGHHEQT